MKQRVHDKAREVGYKPNPMVTALMERVRSAKQLEFRGRIAVINSGDPSVAWHEVHPTHRLNYMSAKKRAEEFGYQLEDFSLNSFGSDGRRLSQILVSRGIQGLFIAPVDGKNTVTLDWDQFSPVTSGYSLVSPSIHRVNFGIYNACRVVCERLTTRGYKRIGLHLYACHDRNTDYRYRAGFLLFQDLIPAKQRVPMNISERGQKEKFMRWLREKKPDAVISAYPEVIEWIREAGLRCPDDIGYVNLNWVPEHQGIAGMYHNPELIGAAVAEIIIALINRNERGIPEHPRRTLISGTGRKERLCDHPLIRNDRSR